MENNNNTTLSIVKIALSAAFVIWALIKAPLLEIFQLFAILFVIPVAFVGSIFTIFTEGSKLATQKNDENVKEAAYTKVA